MTIASAVPEGYHKQDGCWNCGHCVWIYDEDSFYYCSQDGTKVPEHDVSSEFQKKTGKAAWKKEVHDDPVLVDLLRRMYRERDEWEGTHAVLAVGKCGSWAPETKDKRQA